MTPQLCARLSLDQRVSLPPDRHYTGVAWCSAAARGAVGPAPPPRIVRGDVAVLVDALHAATRARSRGTGTSCPLVAPSSFWLLDDRGRAFLPRVPTDSCGQLSRRVTAALTDLFEASTPQHAPKSPT